MKRLIEGGYVKKNTKEVKKISERRIKIPNKVYQELQDEDLLHGKAPGSFPDMGEEEYN